MRCEPSSSEQKPAVVGERIAEEIQAIRGHEHIEKVEKNKSDMYTILYRPSNTNSPYKQKKYTLELLLPPAYPNDPPSIRFLDQIYHLNIGFRSGQVRMPVLEDDWSPFLSLNSIIESLDKILQQPDPQYALDEETLNLYQHDKENYRKKVQENVNHLELVLCESAERRDSPMHEQSPIRKLNHQHQKFLSNKIGKENPQTLVRNLRESMSLVEERKISNNQEASYDGEPRAGLPLMRKAESGGELKHADDRVERKENKSENGRSIEAIQLKLYQANKIAINQKINRDEGAMRADSKNDTLVKINETIKIFIEELNELEAQMSHVKNQGVRALLIERHDAQLEMLRELMSLSEDTKRKIVQKLKQEVSKM